MSVLRDAGVELVDVDTDAIASVEPSAAAEVTVVEPLAIITLVTVDCCAEPRVDDAGIVVRKVEVTRLPVLRPLVASDEEMLVITVLATSVLFAVLDIEAKPVALVVVLVLELFELAVPPAPELTQLSEPSCTVLVLSNEGLLLVKGRPASPVPLA